MRFGIPKPPPPKSPGGDDDTHGEGDLGGEENTGSESLPLTDIEQALDYTFKERFWIERALTHRSTHTRSNKTDYERLEYLGDAVLDLAIAHLLLDSHEEAREGELSKMRAALVNTACLAEIAREINLGPHIRLSRGELASGGAERASILADVFEALVGAVYREAGYETALACIRRLYGERLLNVTPRDPKTELQEALHAAGSGAPEYHLECVEGPEHAPTFVSVVQVDGQIAGRGRGTTKKASQQAAAAQALECVCGEDEVDRAFLLEQNEEEEYE